MVTAAPGAEVPALDPAVQLRYLEGRAPQRVAPNANLAVQVRIVAEAHHGAVIAPLAGLGPIPQEGIEVLLILYARVSTFAACLR
jgi:hypothetical protein